MKIVEVNNLVKKYGRRIILNGISFSVEQGDFIAIVGPSGSGKSTLLNIIGMLETPTSGEIKIMGQTLPDINSKKATMMRRNHINYLFQSFALISDATVKENLLLAMKFKSVKKPDEEINEALASLDISNLKNERVNTLSGGEQQRVALARTILKPGEIVLADEPTGALDPIRAQRAFEQIAKLRSDYGKTIIMVTHNMSEAEKTDRIIDLAKYNKLSK